MKKVELLIVANVLALSIISIGCVEEEQDIRIVHQVPLGPTSKIVYTQSLNTTELNKIIKGIGEKDYVLSGKQFGVYFEINTNRLDKDLKNVDIHFSTKSKLLSDAYLYFQAGRHCPQKGMAYIDIAMLCIKAKETTSF